MAPTRIYGKALLPSIAEGRITGLAHITGGGLLENIPRVLPKGAHARIDAAAWPQLPLMAFLRQQGDITPDEMARTFNCGIGMAVIVTETEVEAVTNALTTANETVHRIGLIRSAQRRVGKECVSPCRSRGAAYH